MIADTFRARCSSLKKIMTNPRSGGGLSETTKTYLEEWYVEKKYGRRKMVTSVEMQKGTQVEDQSITLFSKFRGNRGLIKNTKKYEDEYIVGTPDIVSPINPTEIVDIKSSWDIFTFKKATTRVDPLRTAKDFTDYGWQGIGYLILTGRTEFTLAYCLSNTPEYIVADESRRAWYNRDPNMSEDDWAKVEAEIERNHNYDDLHTADRVRTFSMKLTREELTELKERIEARVEECSDYLREIEEQDNQIQKKWEESHL